MLQDKQNYIKALNERMNTGGIKTTTKKYSAVKISTKVLTSKKLKQDLSA